ncbi:uncharacterized protein ZBAI_04935 [Zygosaccharomyces bailii ISA1307]|nr:uncharacterized protein ZBAI_04935 [Zygosaccharomyces bailii ISA1307]
MRCLLVKSVSKRKLSFDVGKLARDVLIKEKSLSGPRHIAATRMPNENDSITDMWLKRALTKRWDKSLVEGVRLYLPVVLKTLQRLRSSDNTKSYFTLLNKIKSSNVTWISQNGNNVGNRQKVPIEFYHEVSNMIYRMTLYPSNDFIDSSALASFSEEILHQYQQLPASGIVSGKQYQAKFYRNCLMVIIKSESLLSLLVAFKSLPSHQAGLKLLAELSFYHQTGQFTKVLDFLHESILTKGASVTRMQIDAFFPVLFNVLRECLINGEEEVSCKLLAKLTEWNYEMDDHHFTILRELSERFAMNKVLLTLARLRDDNRIEELKEKIVQSRMSWVEYCNYIQARQIDLFRNKMDYDLSQVILSAMNLSPQNWKGFIRQNNIPQKANESLKAFYVNSILINSASHKKIGFTLAVLEHFIYEMQLVKGFIDSHKLAGYEKHSGFHVLFKSISNSSSAKLTAYTLFDFLRQNTALGFRFNVNDFYFSMKTCINSLDYQAVYFFLYQYLLMFGDTLYVKSEEDHDWELPGHMQQIVEMIHISGGDERINEILREVRTFFLAQGLQCGQSSHVDEISLREIFGDKHLPIIQTKTESSLQDNLIPPLASPQAVGPYLPMVDAENAKRLSNCLAFIVAHISS